MHTQGIRPSGFGYSYIPAVEQYSSGVVADEGYTISRYRFLEPPAVAEAFASIEQLLQEWSLPVTALCAFELRSPEPFTEGGFASFNAEYRKQLDAWGITESGDNPVARSNVCPEIDPPSAPSVHAFCVASPSSEPGPRAFVVSGSAESPEGQGSYEEGALDAGDTSPQAIERKSAWVMGEMERRLGLLGQGWHDVAVAQVYTVHPFHTAMASSLRPAVAPGSPVAWYYCRPPVQGLEFEMDCRRVAGEQLIGEGATSGQRTTPPGGG